MLVIYLESCVFKQSAAPSLLSILSRSSELDVALAAAAGTTVKGLNI